MPYLVDGHNLIPHVHGMQLSDLDDEQELVDLLLEFCRLARQKVAVYFDRAAPGHAGARTRGLLTITFMPAGVTADEGIRRRLKKLGKEARNWKVVSSDRQVQVEALAVHAAVLSADEFARLLSSTLQGAGSSTSSREPEMSPEELDDWLRLFKKKKT
jgi:predicted RNA-binding protein with PIN domain